MTVSSDDWAARNAAWTARVERLGVTRAIYHSKHTAEDFPAVTALQRDAIWPHLEAELLPTDNVALDFGCGYGRWTPMLGERIGFAYGVDPTAMLLDAAPRTGDVEYRLYEGGHIPIADASADVLWCCMVLSTILREDMLQTTLAELRRVLHVGSLVCLIDNTSKVDGSPVRSKYSISRTIDEYQAAFAPWVDLRVVGAYQDFDEINTIFVGRLHA